MKPMLIVASFIGVSLAISTCSYAEETFSEFLKRVQSRDAQTKAITAVRVSDANDGDTLFGTKAEIKDRVAVFTFSRSYKTGDKTATFEFLVSEEIAIEVKRMQNFEEVNRLAGEVERAQRAYKVFVLSGYRIHLGDTLEKADKEMGMPRKEFPYGGASASFSNFEYEDGLQVFCQDNMIRNVNRNGPTR